MSQHRSKKKIHSDNIPVLLTIFNRPEKTEAVIAHLRKVSPKRVFIAADGPRKNHPSDREKCRQARKTATAIDWPCQIKTRFLDTNIGVDPAVSSAIDWFFEHVEYGIILEDDCLIHSDFFTFCGELFIRYFDDLRIMQIASLSPYPTRSIAPDYHFSRAFRCGGGWGTWRRAWQHYTHDLRIYGTQMAFGILHSYTRDSTRLTWEYETLLDYLQHHQTEKRGSEHYYDHWDCQWNMACKAQNGLCIVPEQNLMDNIGFDEESTHTTTSNPIFEGLSTHGLNFPLTHPQFVYADDGPEMALEKKIYQSLSLKARSLYLIRRSIGALHYLFLHGHFNPKVQKRIANLLKL